MEARRRQFVLGMVVAVLAIGALVVLLIGTFNAGGSSDPKQDPCLVMPQPIVCP
jgi:hypothetical protein